jgi:hypothetical protein
MRREPSLTLQGALLILGRHEQHVIGKLDKLLGGVILLSGAGAGLAAVGGAALAPLAKFAAVWGWTEQKDAALKLLREAVDAVSGKITGIAGYERRQLITAAHTVIVVAAFFESFREHVGKDFYDQIKIADSEKEFLLADRLRAEGESLLDVLYYAEVPIPSPSLGFEENVQEIHAWMTGYSKRMAEFLYGLSTSVSTRINWKSIERTAVERYRSHFLRLASEVTEFAIWAMLGENAATRAVIGDLRADISAALNQDRGALARVEAMLALTAARSGGVTDLRAVVGRANQGILAESIIPADDDRYATDITFPAVDRMYINPRYRMIRTDRYARPADARWWEAHKSRGDFDLMFAAYVTVPDSTRIPMLLLGDPGAGKSMLMQVVAARLPSSVYTVVRVPLRRVAANAPLVDQIQQALNLATNRRVDWGALSDQSADAIRVVLLDGLDELLQASTNDRSGYLQEVTNFQRIEAEQERPVVVVVTSRIVVADRVDIPHGTTVVKLDTFTDSDIEEWLNRWRKANAAAIAAGKVRALTQEAALQQADLARQPLLLLMLALYTADPTLPALDADMSTPQLYQRLLDEFTRREARKIAGGHARGTDLDQRARDHLERLAVAALGMFNRGRQDISEDELGGDIKALDEKLMGRSLPAEAGQRVIGEFFFVHAPEARLLGAADENSPSESEQGAPRKTTRRSYEFLHATFGEYLVASYVMGELIDVTEKAFAGRRGHAGPDDDLLFALLSSQPLATRFSTLMFAREIFASLPLGERMRVLDVLEVLVSSYRNQHRSTQYIGYRPIPADMLRQLACYSANLVTLRALLEPGGAFVPLAKMLRVSGDGLPEWRSTLMLWRAGLGIDSIQSILSVLVLSGDPIGIRVGSTGSDDRLTNVRIRPANASSGDVWSEVLFARLLGDRDMENRLRYGAAFWDGFTYRLEDDPADWASSMETWLISAISGKRTGVPPEYTPSDISNDYSVTIAPLMFQYLKNANRDSTAEEFIIRALFRMPKTFRMDEYALAAAVIFSPELLYKVPELQNVEVYGQAYDFIRVVGYRDLLGKLQGQPAGEESPPREIGKIIRDILANYAGKDRAAS